MDCTKNFKTAVEKFLKEVVNRKLKLNERSTASINRILNRFLNKIANSLLEQGADKGNEISVSDIQNAMEKYFSESMMRYAAVEGTKVLSLYRNGLIEYHPKTKQFTTSTCNTDNSEKDVTPVHYKKGMNGILEKINSELILNERSCKLLEKIFNLLITKITNGLVRKKISEGNKISSTDIQNELGGDLSEEVMKCAIAEGSRVLLLYHNGFLKYRSKQSVSCVINYKEGIDEILRSINKDFKFKQNSWEFLATVLNTLTTKIFQSLSEENVNNGEVISLTCLRNVLSKRFSEHMLYYANSEGAKALLLYETGLLKYQRKKAEFLVKEDTLSDNISVGVNSFIRNVYGNFDFDTTVGKEISVFLKNLFNALLTSINELGSTKEYISLSEAVRSTEIVLGEHLTHTAQSEGLKAVAIGNCELLMDSEKVVSTKKSKNNIKRPQILSKVSRKLSKKTGVKGIKKKKIKSVICKKRRISSSTKKKLSKKVSVKRKKSKIKKPSVSCKKTRIASFTMKKKSTKLIARRKIKLTVGIKNKRAKNKQFAKEKSGALKKRLLKTEELKKHSSPRKALRKQLSKKKIPRKRKIPLELTNENHKSRKLRKRKKVSSERKDKKLPITKAKSSRKSNIPLSKKKPSQRKISKELPSKRKKSRKLPIERKITTKRPDKKKSPKLPTKKMISKKLPSEKNSLTKTPAMIEILNKRKKSKILSKQRKTHQKTQSKKKMLKKLSSRRKTSAKAPGKIKTSIKIPKKRKTYKKISKKRNTTKKQSKRKAPTKISHKKKTSTKISKRRKTPTKTKKISVKPTSKKKISRKLISKKNTSKKQALKRKTLRSSAKITKKTRLAMSLKNGLIEDFAEIIFRSQLDFVAGEVKVTFSKSALSEICHKLMIIARKIAKEAQNQTSALIPLNYLCIRNALKLVFPPNILHHAEGNGFLFLCDNINNVDN